MQSKPHQTDFKERTAALIGALVVFTLSYPLTNAYTHHLQVHNPNAVASVVSRYDVMPFVAWTIVPYAFSFVLFVASFYVVSSAMLPRLLYRLVLSTLMAGLCFYLSPLSFTFGTPDIPKAWRWAYELLYTFDRPYNQLPSLHACYAVIFWVSLWGVIDEAMSGWWRRWYRLGLSLICMAIALATLFTWQHHVADVAAGFLLAGIVLVIERWLMHLPRLTATAVMKFWVLGTLWFLWWAMVPVLAFDGGVIWVMVGAYGLASLWLMAYLYVKPAWITKVLPKQIHDGRAEDLGKFLSFAYVFGLPIILSYQVMWYVAYRWGFASHDVSARVIGARDFDVVAIGHLGHQAMTHLTQHIWTYDRVIWIDACAEMPSDFAKVYQRTPDDKDGIKWHYVNLGVMDLQPFDEQIMTDIHAVHEQIQQEQRTTLVICQCAMGQSRSVAVMICLLMLQQRCHSQEVPHERYLDIDVTKWQKLLSAYRHHRAWRLLSCIHCY